MTESEARYFLELPNGTLEKASALEWASSNPPRRCPEHAQWIEQGFGALTSCSLSGVFSGVFLLQK